VSSSELTNYEAMCRAIDVVHSVDEAKDIRDKAIALQAYAREANNFDAERKCREIRIRAERKVGELLRNTSRNTGTAGLGRPPLGPRGDRGPKDETPTLASYGLTYDQSSRFQRLAEVPADIFERELKTQCEPSAASIVAAHDGPNPMPDPATMFSSASLWLAGTLRDFEKDGWLSRDPASVMDEPMTKYMREDILRLAPLVAAWLGQITEFAHV
jgi:hypothetical protein